jgi:hypothetical protein
MQRIICWKQEWKAKLYALIWKLMYIDKRNIDRC